MAAAIDFAPGAPAWVELATSDQAASATFYSGLFGWTTTEPDPELGGYLSLLRDGLPIAGCGPQMGDTATDAWRPTSPPTTWTAR